MGESSEKATAESGTGTRLARIGAPIIFVVLYFLVGLFFRRPDMGDPDSYRQALSAFAYVEEGIYSAYWDFPLTMYVFVFGTYLADWLGLYQLAVLNTLAVALGAASVWPVYQLVRGLVSPRAAPFAAAAYVLSPTLIRYSTYLSHEIVGFAFAIWSVYLFERALARDDRVTPFAFGLFFGAAFAARTNGAAFIVPPLLVLLFREKGRFKPREVGKLALFSLLGFALCLLIAHRPDTMLRFKARMDVWFFTYYEIGQFVVRTTRTAFQSLTPALVAAAAAGACALLLFRKRFVALLCAVWIMTVYMFYVGMDICRLKFFLVLVPACMLLVFAGAHEIDSRLPLGRKRDLHAAKLVAVLVLVLLSLMPSLPELMYVRKSKDDERIAKGIGGVVGRELLFTTSLKPMIEYYNHDDPPETIYLITELRPGKLTVDIEALRDAQLRLREGRPVFATGIIVDFFEHLAVDFEAEPVWEYGTQRLFRLTRLNPA